MTSSRGIPASETASTYGTGKDYTPGQLGIWESATDGDLSSGGEALVVDAGTYDDFLNAVGATGLDATHYRVIRPAAGAEHGGITNSGVVFRTTGNNDQMAIGESFFQIQDVCLSPQITTGTSLRYAADIISTNVRLVGVLIHDCSHTGSGLYPYINSAAGGEILNCLVADNDDASASVGLIRTTQGSGTPLLVANTSVVRGANGNRGVHQSTNSMIQCINCIVDGAFSAANYSGTFAAGSDNNASSDTDAPGTNAKNSVSLSYVDAAGGDYHLTSGDQTALGVGADQSGTYTDDIDNDGDVTTWYPGFDSVTTLPTPTGTIDSPPDIVTIVAGDFINILGTASGGTPGYTHLWEIVEAGSGVANSTAADPGATQFDVAGTWTLRYTVTDSLSDVDLSPPTVVVTVVAPVTIAVLMGLAVGTGHSPQSQSLMAAGLSLGNSAVFTDQNEMDLSALTAWAAALAQTPDSFMDLSALGGLGAAMQHGMAAEITTGALVSFDLQTQAEQAQAASLLMAMSHGLGTQAQVSPQAMVQTINLLALASGAGFVPFPALTLSTVGSFSADLAAGWTSTIATGVVNAMAALSSQVGQVSDGVLSIGGVVAQPIVAHLSPSAQAGITRALLLGCSAAQVQAGGILHELIVQMGGAMATSAETQAAIAGTLALGAQQAITAQTTNLATALLALGCTADQIQLGSRLVEAVLVLSLRGAFLAVANNAPATIGNVAVIVAESFTVPTVTDESVLG